MRKMLITSLILSTFNVTPAEIAPIYKRGINCSKHRVFCQIITNKPSMQTKKAMELSNVIFNKAVKYNVSASILTAILMQESSYTLEAKGKHTGYKIDPITQEYKKVTIYSDFGIGQIYVGTIERYGFDVNRLTQDLDYSVEAAAIVLSDFKRKYKKKEPFNWYTRYNASSKIKRQIYKKLIERYL